MTLKPGRAYYLTREVSVQFVNPYPIRVIRTLDWPTYDGWAWVECYELNERGDAVAKRELFVQPAKMRPWVPLAQRRKLAMRAPIRRTPVRVES
ncbi:hypothetical protein ABZ671_30360 [Micromonospora sp. NPDC006766]|uniref:hypothetical protein n=1 Tax=Micromonospora sp. NPDC006766 TaxID=3154778 RepID=UPI003405DD0F